MPLSDPVPSAGDDADREIRERLESGRAEVEVARVAGLAAVDDGDVDRPARVGGAQAAAAEGVVVGVAVGRGGVEVGVAEGDDQVAVAVAMAAGAQAGVVIGEAAGGEDGALGRVDSLQSAVSVNRGCRNGAQDGG